MEGLSDAVAATDSIYSLLAVAIIGLYILLYRFGGQLLMIARENNAVAKDARNIASQAHNEVKQVAHDIVTNHGSENLGASIDRLTDWMLTHMEESRSSEEQHLMLRRELVLHLAAVEPERQRLADTLARVDDRLEKLERYQDQQKGA